MLLNQNSVGTEPGGKLAKTIPDPFDRPIPGQSLTDTPGKHAWEKPPEITKVDDALISILNQLQQNTVVQKTYDQLITLGMPIESIVNTISFGGFVNGLWGVDTAELLKPPLQAALMLYADEKQLPFVISNNQGDMNSTELDDLSDFEILETMKENNPLEYNKIINAINENTNERILKVAKAQAEDSHFIPDNFLVLASEDVLPEEEMPMPMPMPEGEMPKEEMPMPMPEGEMPEGEMPEGGMPEGEMLEGGMLRNNQIEEEEV